MKFIRHVEYWHNKASDTKFVWFPFYFLKPEPQTKIDGRLKIRMTICFGVYYGVFAALRSWIFSNSNFFRSAGIDTGYAVCFFAIWFNAVTAPLWNTRASRLSAQHPSAQIN